MVDAAHDVRRQREERKRGGDASTSQHQRGVARDARLDERTREGQRNDRGAAK